MKQIYIILFLIFLISYSECSRCSEYQTGGGNTGEQNLSGDQSTQNGRILRRLVTDDQCKVLNTIDNNKYKCVVSSDKSKCEEVSKETSKRFNLSYIIFISLSILLL